MVKFSSTATVLCKLTNDQGRLVSCANKMDANGGSNIAAGITLAYQQLVNGRAAGGNLHWQWFTPGEGLVTTRFWLQPLELGET